MSKPCVLYVACFLYYVRKAENRALVHRFFFLQLSKCHLQPQCQVARRHARTQDIPRHVKLAPGQRQVETSSWSDPLQVS